MLQAGVLTKDMDPRWMSSISWYFLCIFGLQFVYVFLLGSDNGEYTSPSLPVSSIAQYILTSPQLRAKLPSRCSNSRCPLVPWPLARILTRCSRPKPKTWPSLNITPSWTVSRSDCWRGSRCRILYTQQDGNIIINTLCSLNAFNNPIRHHPTIDTLQDLQQPCCL